MAEASSEINYDISWAARPGSPVGSIFSELTQLDDEELAALEKEVGNFLPPHSAIASVNCLLPPENENVLESGKPAKATTTPSPPGSYYCWWSGRVVTLYHANEATATALQVSVPLDGGKARPPIRNEPALDLTPSAKGRREMIFDVDSLQYLDDDGVVIELRYQRRARQWVEADWSFEWPDTLSLELVRSIKVRPSGGKMPFHVQATHDKGILCFRGINVNGKETTVSKEEAEDIIAPVIRKYWAVFV